MVYAADNNDALEKLARGEVWIASTWEEMFIQWRTEAIGATLTVESEIGRGTEVMVVWPDIQKCAKDD